MRGPSIIVRTVTSWVVGFILLYGLYIVAFGHLTPGGGFAGGVILASAFVLQLLAWGKEEATARFPVKVAKGLDSAAALLFLGLALLGLVFAGAFFLNAVQRNWPGQPLRLVNGGIVPLCNVAIGLKVCASLFLVTVVLSVLRVRPGGTEDTLTAEEED